MTSDSEQRIIAAIEGLETRVQHQISELRTEMHQQMGLLSDRLSHVETKVDQLEIRFDQLGTKVDNLETRFDQLGTKVDNLETKVEKFDQDLRESNIRMEAYQKGSDKLVNLASSFIGGASIAVVAGTILAIIRSL